MNKQDTLFFGKAIKYQSKEERTKEAGVKAKIKFIVVGAIILVVSYLLLLTFSQPSDTFLTGGAQRELQEQVGTVEISDSINTTLLPLFGKGIGWIGMIAGVVVVLVGVFQLITNIIEPTKNVTCKKCGFEHKVSHNTSKYMCTNCGELMLLGDKSNEILEYSICPYCELQTAIANSYGLFLCSNCGIVRSSSNKEFVGKSINCPECNTSVPEDAFYCTNCQSILRTEFNRPGSIHYSKVYDHDWIIGKNSTGHLYYARILLQSIRKGAENCASPEGIITPIMKIPPLQTKLEEVLLSVEVAWQDPDTHAAFSDIIPEIDEVYKLLLECELRNIEELGGGTKILDDRNALIEIAKEPYLTSRRRVEQILDMHSSHSEFGSIGEWSEQLIDIIKDDDYVKVNSLNKLEMEIDRLQKRARH